MDLNSASATVQAGRTTATRLSGHSVLVLNTSSSTPAGPASITISSDPIGSSATFELTVTGAGDGRD